MKHLKILYNFFLNKKKTSIKTIILLSLVSTIDNSIIYFSSYELIYLIKHSISSIVLNIIIGLIIIRFFFYIFEIFYNRCRFYQIFDKNLFKFFISIPSNKEIFNKNQKTDNILRFQWEMNILANETNKNYSQILSNFTISATSLIFIIVSLLNNFNKNILSIALLSFLFTIIVYISHNIKKIIEKKILDHLDRDFILINELLISEIDHHNYKETDEKYKTFIQDHLKKIKNTFIKIFAKKTFFDGVFLILQASYFISITYFSLQYINYRSINLDEFIISFVIYNIIYNIYSQKFVMNLFDRNLFSIISQNNVFSVSENTKSKSSVLESSINIENFSFKNVCLECEDEILENINFSMNIKSNILIISENNNVSLLRKYFENKEIKKYGQVLINNIEIEKLNKKILENIIVTISTDIKIQNDTIKKNILPENSQISDEIVIKACRLSHLYNYISLSKLGFYTIIDDSTPLSKLEKFQISLTRALLSDAHIIIIDFTEVNENDYIINNIKEMLILNLIDRILVLITKNTFRCQEIQNILFVENNKIICTGYHKNLIQNNNQYCNFYLKNHNDIKFTDEKLDDD